MLMKVISLQDMHQTGTRECSYLICCYTPLYKQGRAANNSDGPASYADHS